MSDIFDHSLEAFERFDNEFGCGGYVSAHDIDFEYLERCRKRPKAPVYSRDERADYSAKKKETERTFYRMIKQDGYVFSVEVQKDLIYYHFERIPYSHFVDLISTLKLCRDNKHVRSVYTQTYPNYYQVKVKIYIDQSTEGAHTNAVNSIKEDINELLTELRKKVSGVRETEFSEEDIDMSLVPLREK